MAVHLSRWQRHFGRYFSSLSSTQRVCIVGSGPAAFYTAQYLLKNIPSVHVDLVEKLPVPFGLVRYGVAPDHPEVKNVINTFTQVARNERFRFFGNVSVGEDVSVEQLKSVYTAVVLAYGAAKDQTLDIPGEDLPDVLSARDLVGWYNGLPENESLRPNLRGDTAAVIGHGNVALDVARILLSPIALLRRTDIPEPVLDALSASNIKRVVLIGRRGPLQTAFTIKEVRELIRLPECGHDLQHVTESCPQLADPDVVASLPRPRKRLTELLMKKDSLMKDGERMWSLRFLRTPAEIVPCGDGAGVSAIRLSVNEFASSDEVTSPSAKVTPTSLTETLPCSLVLRSIGYKSTRIDPSLPWDTKLNRIPNVRGHVEDNLFCSGWIKRGPTGVLLSTVSDGKETGKELSRMLGDGELRRTDEEGVSKLVRTLQQSGRCTSFSDWERIDEEEIKTGREVGKPREKFTSIDKMLNVARKKDE